MRNPNGYGSVYKLSGKRRKPYMARKTIGWDENGKQLYQTVGYYEKKADALIALSEFNENPYDISVNTATFSDIFEKWSEQKFETIGKSAVISYNASYKACESLYDMRFVDIKTRHLQDCIKSSEKNYSMLKKIKTLFNQLFKYAMENDIVDKDYSDYVDIGKKVQSTKKNPFTKAEIDRLFDVVDDIEFVDSILIMIYTGLRIGELIIIKSEDVDLEERTITGGIKTEAGMNRVVPINGKILPYIERRLSYGHEYLITRSDGSAYSYNSYYRDHFAPIMKKLNMDHKPHECRHTFATLMSNAGADKIALQKIIGHKDYKTTANIYTHKDIDELRKAMDLI